MTQQHPYGAGRPEEGSGAGPDSSSHAGHDGFGRPEPAGYAQPGSGQYPGGAPQPQYGQPQYGEPQYGEPQYGQPRYGQPQDDRPPYDQAPYGQASGPVGQQYGAPGQQYGQPQDNTSPYGQTGYGQPQPGQQPYGQPLPGQGWAGGARPPGQRRPTWKTVLGWILTVIGALGTLGLMSTLGNGRFAASVDGPAEMAGYLFGTVVVSIVPLVAGIVLLNSKK